MGRGPRSWARGVVLVATLALAGAGLGGCTLSDVPVAVAGWDTDGTLVVGAVDCSTGGGRPNEITLVHDSEIAGEVPLWSVSPDGGSGMVVRSDLPPPPEPVPSRLDEVPLISAGDPTPLDWDTTLRLSDPLPEGGRFRVMVDFGYREAASDQIVLDVPSRGVDRYTAVVDGRRLTDVDGATLGTDIQDVCDEATAFDGGRFATIVGVSTVVVVLVGVLLGVVATRQFRRAGRAAAERRAGPPPRPA